MELPLNHKTVILLDRGPYQRLESGVIHDVNKMIKVKGDSRMVKPIPTTYKSLWSCAVTASLEYARMVWDIYTGGKVVSFFINERFATRVNSWEPKEQTFHAVMNQLAELESQALLAGEAKEPDSARGIKAAVSFLSERTETQKARWPKAPPPSNKGRIVYFTHMDDPKQVAKLEEAFSRALLHVSEASANLESNIMCVDHCELLVINLMRDNGVAKFPDEHKKISSFFTFIVNSVTAKNMSNKIRCYALDHYDLASLTVTGIPMKEENHSNASTNYDVEVFHPRSAHLGQDESDFCRTKTKAGYETLTLRWVAPPRADASIMNLVYSASRVTFAEVYSRPSTCLTNFILGGRIVMLEMPKGKEGAYNSHMLSAHKDEIFIHSIRRGKDAFENAVELTEGVGGAVQDYRVSEFVELMEANLLAEWPCEVSVSPKVVGNAPELTEGITSFLKHNARRLSHHTAHMPLTTSSTFIPHLRPHIDPLLKNLTKQSLTQSEVNEAKRGLYAVFQLEKRGELNHIVPAAGKSKGSKKENPFQELWDEITLLVKENLRSKGHEEVYRELLSLSGKEPEKLGEGKAEASEKTTRKRPAEFPTGGGSKQPKTSHGFKSSNQSVLDIWNGWIIFEDKSRQHVMPGQLREGNAGEKLYINLKSAAQAKDEPIVA